MARHATGIAIALALAACGPSSSNHDAGPGSDGPMADASLFGSECQTDAECPNGFCVEGFGTKVCTFECTAGCPPNWDCRTNPVHGNPVSVCVPPAFELCTPCSADAQCGAGVCVSLGGEGFCLPQCPFEGSCPQGYTCGPDPSGKNEGQYCVPMTSACTCTSGAQEGQLRTCSKMNAVGTCRGLETCDPVAGGWMGCTAQDAVIEQCDGIDNDCDSLVDDGTSGQACTNTVAGVGSCPGVTICTGVGGTICQGKMPVTEICNYTDDDCDLMTDEGHPNLNTMCSAGVGGCQRFGLMRCTAAGTGTECSVVAGPSSAELCNNVDDDCNGTVDEPFTTKGQSCTVGVGACVRQGNQVCAMNGAGTTCSVTPGMPGTEACNTIDDDCDTRVDEDFKDMAGQYTRDRACGSCAVDCTAIYGLPNAFGTCAAGPQCVMNCMPGSFNLDGATANGCEFLLDATGAIYVSADDAAAADDATCGLGPAGTGGGRHPCRSIAQGLSRAQSLGYTRVLVANGIYDEGVTVRNGISLLGGHRPDNWVRDIAATGTVISGFTSLGVHDVTVNASNITTATVVEGFAIYGSVNSKPRGNSYAIYASGSSASLTIRSNVILGGRGGPGANGTNGVDGTAGGNGGGRTSDPVTDLAYDAKAALGTGACSSANDRNYSNGGASVCAGDDVSGGNGGGNRCPASPLAVCSGCVCNPGQGCGCTTCNFVNATPSAGQPGQPGNVGGGGMAGNGGARGEDMINKTISGTSLCFIPPGQTYGENGTAGRNGANGGGVPGCSMAGGSVSGGHWSGAIAASGLPGANGGGGGGGGAGGGAHCDGCQSGFDNFGGHGGGGGGGGCGGAAGGGASTGGGAFGIFIAGGTAPTITRNTIVRGEGGVGGAGGAAGRGGVGGSGGAGGNTGSPSLFCSDVAGHGGRGGNGGQGSGGAGGCGGSSFGIYTSGVGTPNYCMAASMNAYSGGTGGGGGPGGYSVVNPGGAGAAGALLDCSFN